jgi:hypothetical protein
VLLAGDAAGLVDPFSGEGIRPAIGSGRLAAEAILAGRPAQYASLVARRTVFDTLIGLGVSILFYNLAWPCFELGARNPFSTRAFLDLFAGRSGYAVVMLQVFGTMPFFLATEAVAFLAGAVGGAGTTNRIRQAAYFG